TSKRIAVSPKVANRNIEIFNFDDLTGALTPALPLGIINSALNSLSSQAIYDTEWSKNGQYLYVSVFGEPGIQADVLQYDLLNPNNTAASVLNQKVAISRSYGLQMAPDSLIYHLYQATSGGSFFLGSLSNTDSLASKVIYDSSAFVSNPNFNAFQFPSFAPKDTVKIKLAFTSEGTCSNAPTSFYPTVVPGADSLVWNFGDGSGTSDWSPVHTYQSAQTYNVKVKAFLGQDTVSVTQQVTITQFDLKISLVQDTTACSCELPFPRAKNPPPPCPQFFSVKANISGGTPTSTQWYGPSGPLAGQTTATLSPDSAGYYYVVVKDASGCFAYAGVNIKEYHVQDQRANIWYFGNKAGIDFNPVFDTPPGSATPITGPLNTIEGCADICDRNGQVIFSTDGQNIFNRLGTDITPAPNPPGLGGEPGATQSSIIIPVPGDETLFYIFTTQEIQGSNTYELRYSLFDLKLNNGLGGLTKYNVLLFAKSTERITSNGNWLIAHEYGNNSFRAYQVTSAGIGNPVISSIGSDHASNDAANGQGYMKLSSTSVLAVAFSTPNTSNTVELFDFIDSTGMVTNFRSADLKNPTGQVYGIEFSPGGNKLYATLFGPPSTIYEFSIDSVGMPHLKQAVSKPDDLGALQIGPDGQIYMAINGSGSLGTFQPVEDTTQLTNFATIQPFGLAGNTSLKGLPNFTQIISDPVLGPGMSVTELCYLSLTTFIGNGTDPRDSLEWFFGDNTGATGDSATHVYSAPGNYIVRLHIYNIKCGYDSTITQKITIYDIPPDPTTSVNLCIGAAVIDANPANLPNLSYVWSTGDTTETITVNVGSPYNVTVTNAQGCTRDGVINVIDGRNLIDLGPDITTCSVLGGIFSPPLNTGIPTPNHQWFLDGVLIPGNNSNVQSVDLSVPKPNGTEYKVIFTNPITGCITKDSISYTINESPQFNPITDTNPTCPANNNGQIHFSVTSPSGLFSIFSPTGFQFDIPTGQNVIIPGLGAGGTITVTDQVTTCSTTKSTGLINTNFTVSATQSGTCDPTISIAVNTSPFQGVQTYSVFENTGLTLVDTGTPTPPPTGYLTNPLPSGVDYFVEVKNAAGCIAISPVVNFIPSATIVVTLPLAPACDGTLTAVAPGATATGFDWSGSSFNSLVAPSVVTSTVIVKPGSHIIKVKADDGPGGLCPGFATLPVLVDDPIVASFSPSDKCQDQVTLTATPTPPSASYTYRWDKSSVPFGPANVLAGTGISISVPLNENNFNYKLTVVSASLCPNPTNDTPVLVEGLLTVDVDQPPTCEGEPFTLTATTNRPGASFEWTLDGNLISTSNPLTDTRKGLYEVTARILGCSDKADAPIVPVHVKPGLLAGQYLICPEGTTDVNHVVLIPYDNSDSEYDSYNWKKNGIDINYTDPTLDATDAGTYSVDLVYLGCTITDETNVKEECDPVIVGPTAFRPTSTLQQGGDMVNQTFRLFTFFISDDDFQVFIFNRWGEMIYQTNQRDFRWNGGYNNDLGTQLPSGTYSYVVKYKSQYHPEQGVMEKHGGVVLLR
ncbi:MAG: PKD domain-containing protein, partial [Chryseolinea sp.]